MATSLHKEERKEGGGEDRCTDGPKTRLGDIFTKTRSTFPGVPFGGGEREPVWINSRKELVTSGEIE